jgi:hypothetical protein
MSCSYESKCTQYRITVPGLFGTDLDLNVRITKSGYIKLELTNFYF